MIERVTLEPMGKQHLKLTGYLAEREKKKGAGHISAAEKMVLFLKKFQNKKPGHLVA